MKLTGLAQEVFLDRYAVKDKKGQPLEKTPEAMWRRVARGIAQVEKTPKLQKEWEVKFYQAMVDFKFVPGGRILAGAGTENQVTYFNCFVLPPPEDSRKGIIKTLEIMTEIMARGGGVGINLSSLRPRGSYIRAVNGTSSGPVSWAQLYSVATGDIIQQGGSRRGALMLMLNDDHPDVEEFITVKKTPGKLQYANLSVGISDKFMQEVTRDGEWKLKWQGKVWKTLKARHLWGLICQSAWASAEPGVIFLERCQRFSNSWYFEEIVGVNVCGEQPLPAWGICNLGALNLSAFVKNGIMDHEKLIKITKVAVRFLDNVIEAENYLYPQMRENQVRSRRMGLGTMGLADALLKMQVRYGSEKALVEIEKTCQVIRRTAYETSADLALERGSFPAFVAEKYLRGKFIQALPEEVRRKIAKQGIRNTCLLTQAPTGTISLLAGCSSGIEPIFAFSYKKKDRLGEHLIAHPLLEAWQKKNPGKKIPDWFVNAMDLTPEEHIRAQALIQKYTDSSISKTVNAPQEHTVEEVKKLYNLAYELGCKGITYMREGSREAALERVKEEGKRGVEVRPRPEKVVGATYRLETPVGTAFVTVNQNHRGEPLEVFVNVGKAGSDIAAMAEGLGRLVSLVLRVASPLPVIDRAGQIVDQLHGIGGSKSLGFGQKRIRSLPDAIAKAVAIHFGLKMKNGNNNYNGSVEKVSEENMENGDGFDLCPKCGQASLVYEEGCRKCHLCGFTEC